MADIKEKVLSWVKNNFQPIKINNVKLNLLENSKWDAFLPIIYDRRHKINCILNLQSQEVVNQLVSCQKIMKLFKVEIKDASFDIQFFKTDNIIKFLIVLVINDCELFEDEKKDDIEYYEKLENINFMEEIQEPLKKFLFNKIKSNYSKEPAIPHWLFNENAFKEKVIPYSNYLIENIFFDFDSLCDGKLSFLYSKDKNKNTYGVIKLSEKFEHLESAIQINPSLLKDELIKEILEESKTNENVYKKIFYNTMTIEILQVESETKATLDR
ncbi:MAG: hypothetical protein MJ252_01145 [archaeon]|nr:hypothetical protein [archaeon]